MIQLIYASAASVPFDTEDLKDLLEKARRRNQSVDVTGLLLYDQGSFLQVLEGPAQAVEEIHQRISQDPRHKEMLLLYKGDIEERSFESWCMGFVDPETARQKIAGFSDFFGRGLASSDQQTLSKTAKQVLSQFREGKWRRLIR